MQILTSRLRNTALLALLAFGLVTASTQSMAHGYYGGPGYRYYQPYYGGYRGYGYNAPRRYHAPRYYGGYGRYYGPRNRALRYNDRSGYGYSLNRPRWYGY
ncbi:MAG: hypothetical protein ACR2O0_06745 [Rhizobiaceae bacterium]